MATARKVPEASGVLAAAAALEEAVAWGGCWPTLVAPAIFLQQMGYFANVEFILSIPASNCNSLPRSEFVPVWLPVRQLLHQQAR